MSTFTCPECGATSHHPEDLRHGYCGACHAFTALPAEDLVKIWSGIPAERVIAMVALLGNEEMTPTARRQWMKLAEEYMVPHGCRRCGQQFDGHPNAECEAWH